MHNLTDEWFAMQAAATQPWLPRGAEEKRDQARAQARLVRLAGAYFGADCYVAPDARVFTQSLVLGDRSWIAAGAILRGEIAIGADCSVNPYAHLAGRITIGRDCRIGAQVCIFGFEHGADRTDVPIRQQEGRSRGVVLEDDVMVGIGAILEDGVRVGAHSVIRPGAVLESSFPAFSVIGGNPARRLRDRRPHGPSGSVRALLCDADPYAAPAIAVAPAPLPADLPSPVPRALLEADRPSLLVQLGAGDGTGAARLAAACATVALEADIVCVDTWLGGWRDRVAPGVPGAAMPMQNGHPTLYWRFLATVEASGHAARITPLPLPQAEAALLFRALKLAPQLILCAAPAAIGGALSEWAALLPPGGAMIGPAGAAPDGFVATDIEGQTVYRRPC